MYTRTIRTTRHPISKVIGPHIAEDEGVWRFGALPLGLATNLTPSSFEMGFGNK